MEEGQPHEASLCSLGRALPFLPDIDDIVQGAYERLLRAEEAGRINYAKAFLVTTVRNAAIDILRRRKVVSIVGVANVDELSVMDDKPGAADVRTLRRPKADVP